MSLAVEIEWKSDGLAIVTPRGRLDTTTYRNFEKQVAPLLEPASRCIVFDLASLDYISSAGVKVVLNTRHTLAAAGGQLILASLQPQVWKVLDLIDALPELMVFDNRQAALDHLARAGE